MSKDSTHNLLVYLLKQQEARAIAAEHVVAQEQEKLRQTFSIMETLLHLSGPFSLVQLGTCGGSDVLGNLELVIPIGDFDALQRTGLAVELSAIELLEVRQIPQGTLYSLRLPLRYTGNPSLESVQTPVTLLQVSEDGWSKLLQGFWGITAQSLPGTYDCRAQTTDELARLGRLMDDYIDAVAEGTSVEKDLLYARLEQGDF
jgi:hypothetical protein